MEKSKHYTATDLNKVLPKETAEKYKLVNIGKRSTKRTYYPQFGVIDFSTLSLAKAKDLVKRKAPFIEEIKPANSSRS